MLNVGIDIGGTKIAGGVVDTDGRILDHLRVATPPDTDALARAVADMVAELASRHDVHAVGVAAAGYIDRTRSIMLHAPNIDWRNAPLRAQFEALIGRPVTLENDANAAGWGEYRFGAGRGSTDMVMVTLGTGVGGAVITEQVFGWKGMGELVATGLRDVDPMPVMAFFLVTGTAAVLMNLVADVLYAVLDPRIRV